MREKRLAVFSQLDFFGKHTLKWSFMCGTFVRKYLCDQPLRKEEEGNMVRQREKSGYFVGPMTGSADTTTNFGANTAWKSSPALG